MAGEYSNLNIGFQEKIIPTVEEFLCDNFKDYALNDDFILVNGGISRLKFSCDGKEMMLDFYFKDGGKTTISPTSGGNNQIKIDLCEHIKRNLIQVTDSNSTMTVREVSADDFEGFKSLIVEDCVSLEELRDVNADDKRSVYELIGKNKEKATLTYYNSGTVLLQGRPLRVFTEVSSFLAELFSSSNEILKVLKDTYKTTVQLDDVSKEYNRLLPNTVKKNIDSKLEIVLKQAVYQLYIDNEMYEYTQLLSPSLRAIEGIMKHYFNEQKLPKKQKSASGNRNKKVIRDYFDQDLTGKYFLKDEADKEFSTEIKYACGDLYSVYKGFRNTYFHWGTVTDSMDDTQIIRSKEKAHGYIYDILDVVDKFYSVC